MSRRLPQVRGRPFRRGASGGLAGLVAAPLLVLAGSGDGLPVSRLQMSGGAAWLASPSQGVVTLIDGASEQVVGLLPAPDARAGDGLSVVQSGQSGYVVNETQGTVARVDGGTYEVSDPVRFGTPGGGLAVFAGGPGLFVVSGSRRTASVTDPATLRERERLSLAAQPGPGQSVVDTAGRLWVLDSAGGGLSWFQRGTKRVRPEFAGTESRLALVQGEPVLVDLTGRRAGRLADGGEVRSWSCFEVRGSDRPQVLGSSMLPWVVAAVSGSGTLVGSRVDRDDCGLTIDVGRPGDEFGPLVESGGFVFVPNRTSGRTAVVDLTARKVVADLPLIGPGRRLELVAKDGLVFYNDLDGDRAGVIKFDGQQWTAGTALRKYDRSDAGKGLLVPAGPNASGRDAADGPGDRRPDRDDDPGRAPSTPDPGGTEPDPGPAGADPGTLPDPGTAPDPADPAGPPDPDPAPGPGSDPDPGSSPDPSPGPGSLGGPLPPVIQSVTASPNPVVLGRTATFAAEVTGADGATWQWTLTGGGRTLHEGGEPRQATVAIPADAPDSLSLRLVVTTAAGTDQRELSFPTTAAPVPQIRNLAADPAEPGANQLVTFTAEEPVGGAAGTWTWTATAAGGGVVAGPTRQPGLQPFRFRVPAGDYVVTLRVEFGGTTDEDSIPVSAISRCVVSGPGGSTVDLRTATTGTVALQLARCFDPDGLRSNLHSQNWLSVSGSGQVDGDGNGTFTVTVRRIADPPADGLVENAFRYGDRMLFHVHANLPPVNLMRGGCNPDPAAGTVAFTAHFDDGDPPNLRATVTIGGTAHPLTFTENPPPNLVAFYWVVTLPASSLPAADSFSFQARDTSGAVSAVEPLPRGTCW